MKLISKEGLKKLELKLKKVEEEIMNTQIEMGKSAKNDNDLRENPEYMDLRVKLMYTLPNEKNEILEKMKKVQIIEETAEYINFNGMVIPGSIVKVDFDGEVETYRIVGHDEAILYNEDVLSCNAPISEVLIGKRAGDELLFNNFKIKVIEVHRA